MNFTYPSCSASFTSAYLPSAARADATICAARAESAAVAARGGSIRMCEPSSDKSPLIAAASSGLLAI